MGAPRIKDEVLRYLSKQPGSVVWRKDIAIALGFTDDQVTSAIGSVMRSATEAKDHVIVVEQGRAWRWSETLSKPVETPIGVKRLFEEIATLPDGRIIAKGDDNEIYWVEKLK